LKWVVIQEGLGPVGYLLRSDKVESEELNRYVATKTSKPPASIVNATIAVQAEK